MHSVPYIGESFWGVAGWSKPPEVYVLLYRVNPHSPEKMSGYGTECTCVCVCMIASLWEKKIVALACVRKNTNLQTEAFSYPC